MATSTIGVDAAAIRRLHERAIIIDGRDPTFLTNRQIPRDKDKTDYVDVLLKSGATAVSVDVPWIDDTFMEGLVNFTAWHERVAASGGRALIVRTVEDIRSAKKSGKIGIILGSQTATIFEKDLRLIRACYELGLRVTQLVYQRRNLMAEGCGEKGDGGLSQLGRDAVTELNRLGIAIDLSHASDKTMTDTIELSTVPVFFSHANVRSVVNVVRNVPDDTLRRLAEKGGMCCVCAISHFLKSDGNDTGTTPDDMARMARHIADRVGVENVGFGLDVGESRIADEVAMIGGGADIKKRYALASRSELPELTAAFARVGFHEREIEGILGGNLLRFYGDVWKG